MPFLLIKLFFGFGCGFFGNDFRLDSAAIFFQNRFFSNRSGRIHNILKFFSGNFFFFHKNSGNSIELIAVFTKNGFGFCVSFVNKSSDFAVDIGSDIVGIMFVLAVISSEENFVFV